MRRNLPPASKAASPTPDNGMEAGFHSHFPLLDAAARPSPPPARAQSGPRRQPPAGWLRGARPRSPLYSGIAQLLSLKPPFPAPPTPPDSARCPLPRPVPGRGRRAAEERGLGPGQQGGCWGSTIGSDRARGREGGLMAWGRVRAGGGEREARTREESGAGRKEERAREAGDAPGRAGERAGPGRARPGIPLYRGARGAGARLSLSRAARARRPAPAAGPARGPPPRPPAAAAPGSCVSPPPGS